MTRAGSARHVLIILLSLTSAAALLAQERPPAPATNPARNNPHLGNKESIRSGMALYRIRCADCHGLDGGGYRGPDLVAEECVLHVRELGLGVGLLDQVAELRLLTYRCLE